MMLQLSILFLILLDIADIDIKTNACIFLKNELFIKSKNK